MKDISAGVRFFLPFKKILISGLLIEGAILLLALALRLWALDLKPAHFDEGINGWFVDQMHLNGCYRYDPENYHGPFYFYLLFASLALLGRNLWALRLPSVLASAASVWMALRFDRYLGSMASRFGAFALALSPGALFFGRYAIHESWLVLALMITTWGIMGIWKSGGRRELLITAIGLTLMFLLKETAVIHLACFLISAFFLIFWQRILPSQSNLPPVAKRWSLNDLSLYLLLSLALLIFFYSGTFLNWPGIPGFFTAYSKWFHTGVGEGGHVKADYQAGPLNYYWIALMLRYEWPVFLGLLYSVRLAWPSPAMMRYLAIYGTGVLVAYSVIPYKTPWCVISITWPFFLLFGCAVQELWEKTSPRFLAPIIAAVVLAISLSMALRLNFRHFTDPKEPYVYVQTMPEIVKVTEPVLAMARLDPRNYAMGGQIILDSYYPLPWIFGDFTRIGYYDKMPEVLDGEFIVALSSQQKAVENHLRESYLKRRFQLRDSMDECTVWFKERVFRNWFANPLHGTTERTDPPHQ